MTVVVDAGPVVAAADGRDPRQGEVEQILRTEPGPLVLPAPVSAEVDYLLGRRLGAYARRAFLEDLARGRFHVPCLDLRDYEEALGLERTYADLDLGLADLSIVAMAARFDTDRLLTFDERDFRAVRSLRGTAFTLLPADR